MNRMNTFELELAGERGEFWRKDARKRLEKVKNDIVSGDITIDSTGVARNRLGRVVMSDMADIIEQASKDIDCNFDKKNTEIARKKEDREFIEEYRKQQMNCGYSQETLSEMRAVFGDGTTVVDVLSGRQIKL